MYKKIISAAFLVFINLTIFAQEQTKDTVKLDEVVISPDALVGSKFKAKNRSGSTYFISPAELKIFNYDDISRIVRSVPGISIQEEEGFGLRPNIGMRGTSPNRSEKITVMEDGVLIAPAPYAAPAAYYFPTVNRMQSFEILKGGSQIQYGPYTTGGAINMISTQIPSKFSGNFTSSVGRFNTKKTYVNLGDSYKNFGYLIEYNNRNSDGFKTIDNTNKKAGFGGNDYVAKFKVNSNPNAKIFQSLTLKLQYSEEVSNETYLGLTQTDFDANPYRRYAASAEDFMDTEHKQIMITHYIKPSSNLTFTTKAYRNDFARDWYRLNTVKIGSTAIAINNILENPTLYQAEYLAISGQNNTVDNALQVRSNYREYEVKGIQTAGNYKFNLGKTTNELEFGIRYHEDFEDRFQKSDGYAIRNGRMLQTSYGTPGTDGNRIISAEAIAAHALWNINYGKFTFSPGMRHETINLVSKNYGNNDVNRTGISLVETENKVNVWIPGFGILYAHTDSFKYFASVHKGFSPPGTTVGQDSENSVNSEIGLRFTKKRISGELIGYYNNFTNLQGSDNMSAGGSGTGDLFNAGKAIVKGIEFLFTYDIIKTKNIELPITFSYTLTDTKLKSNFNSTIWGNVIDGDEIPYIAQNQFSILTNLKYKKWDFALSSKYVDAFRTRAGQGEIASNVKVNSNFIVDASAKYFITKKVAIMSNIVNLFDSQYAVSRVPAGLRPGHPFGINAGIMARF